MYSLRLCAFAFQFFNTKTRRHEDFSAPLRLRVSAFHFLCVLCVLSGAICSPAALLADPWGKDADLARRPCSPPPSAARQEGPGIAFSELFIKFHQEVISPADGPRSHFIPSSSQYTLDAVRTYGFFKGWMMGCDRLMRENDDPWVYRKCLNPAGQIMKYDPIK